jgi:FAD synthetase
MSGRVLVFGTFDGLHSGHIFFLRQARALGTHLTVSIARDAHIRELKHKMTCQTEQKRLQLVKKIESVDEAILSDETLGTFDVIPHIQPDLIVLGYDQLELSDALTKWMKQTYAQIPMKFLPKRNDGED